MADNRICGMRILLVEDDADLREAISDTLELAGTRVIAVAGGAQALQALATEGVDLVVSDVNMDGMDGHALLRRIREIHPQVPVVLMSLHFTMVRLPMVQVMLFPQGIVLPMISLFPPVKPGSSIPWYFSVIKLVQETLPPLQK